MYKVIGTRRFHELLPGDIFKAVIHDIRPGEVTIRFNEGNLYTARSMVLPEARIGEESLFSVRENDFEGRIILEMVKSDADTKKNNMLTDALANAGLSVTSDMLTLGRNIIDSGLPIDASTLQKATFFANAGRQNSSQANPSSVILLLRENMPAVPDTINTINRIIRNPEFLLEALNLVKFSPLNPLAKNTFPNYFRHLYTGIMMMLSQPETPAAVKERLKEARDNLLFMSRLKHRKYFQIPFATTEKPLIAEFHSNASASSAAVIAIKTANLGRVELLVQKGAGTIEFRADNETTLKKLKQAAPKLTSLTASGFKIITEPFTILTPMLDNNQKSAPTPERYTFDMRV